MSKAQRDETYLVSGENLNTRLELSEPLELNSGDQFQLDYDLGIQPDGEVFGTVRLRKWEADD